MTQTAISYKTSLCRWLSKMGYCSRNQAIDWILEGRIKVQGKTILDPGLKVLLSEKNITITHPRTFDVKNIQETEKIYLMLNKPRGLVTTAKDEKGRNTVYSCLPIESWVFPVGRLDMASEGLLLFTNDSNWAEKITNPNNHIPKNYHVQISGCFDSEKISLLEKGIVLDEGDYVHCKVKVLRSGEKNVWLEIILEEGHNREIRRMMKFLGHDVLRLIRISIGKLSLGDLAKGKFRMLSKKEIEDFHYWKK